MKFTQDHEWIKEVSGNIVRVGITDYAIESLGDIVFIDMPTVGQECNKGDIIANIESVKAASDIYSPVSGVVFSVNEALIDRPELLNEHDQGSPVWIFELEISDPSEFDDLMDEDDYLSMLDQ